MFITEQHIDHNIVKKSRKRDFRPGMPMAKPRIVKRKFTYKEFTLVLGVCVAMIIAITLWVHKADDQHTYNRLIPQAEKLIPAINTFVKSVFFRL
jgi:hypothetical protein